MMPSCWRRQSARRESSGMRTLLSSSVLLFLVQVAALLAPEEMRAQDVKKIENPESAKPAAAPPAKPAFKPEELDQLVAPVALHPASLLSQILMASTYPIEVILAD